MKRTLNRLAPLGLMALAILAMGLALEHGIERLGVDPSIVLSAQQPTSVVSHGNGAELVVGDSSVSVNITSATTTQIVALSAGKVVYVTHVSLHAVGNATPVTAVFEYGTGSTCGTGTTALTGPYTGATASTSTTSILIGHGLGYVFKTAVSNALCILSTGTAGLNGVVSYAQF